MHLTQPHAYDSKYFAATSIRLHAFGEEGEGEDGNGGRRWRGKVEFIRDCGFGELEERDFGWGEKGECWLRRWFWGKVRIIDWKS